MSRVWFEGLYFMKGLADGEIDFGGGVNLDYVEFPIGTG